MKEKSKVEKNDKDTGFNILLIMCVIMTVINFYFG